MSAFLERFQIAPGEHASRRSLRSATATRSIAPAPYQAFFLYIEPFATLVGAFYAWFNPLEYLQLTDAASAPGILGLPVATNVVLRQLGNLYFCFALNEAVVLRITDDIRVWRALLVCLLIADFGHLFSCYPLGLRLYYDVQNWNAIDYGNILFVYCGALTRILFLSGVGFPSTGKSTSKKSKPKAIKGPKTPSPTAPAFAEDDSPAKSVQRSPRSSRKSKTKTT